MTLGKVDNLRERCSSIKEYGSAVSMNVCVSFIARKRTITLLDLDLLKPEFKDGISCCGRTTFRHAGIAGIDIPLGTANTIASSLDMEPGFAPTIRDNFAIIKIPSRTKHGAKYGHVFVVRKAENGVWYRVDPYWKEFHLQELDLDDEVYGLSSICFEVSQQLRVTGDIDTMLPPTIGAFACI